MVFQERLSEIVDIIVGAVLSNDLVTNLPAHAVVFVQVLPALPIRQPTDGARQKISCLTRQAMHRRGVAPSTETGEENKARDTETETKPKIKAETVEQMLLKLDIAKEITACMLAWPGSIEVSMHGAVHTWPSVPRKKAGGDSGKTRQDGNG